MTTNNIPLSPPKAPRIARSISKHKQKRTDYYYWLRDKENPETIAYLNAENDYTQAVMSPTENLQQQLFGEIKARIEEADMSVPYYYNGYLYFVRHEVDKSYPIFCRKKANSPNALEEIMLDVNQEAQGHSFFSITNMVVSDDNQWLAYGVDLTGGRISAIYIKNLVDNSKLNTALENVCQIEWAADNKTLLYSFYDDALRSYQIKLHSIGTSQKNDLVLFTEKDETCSCYIGRSQSREFLFIECYNQEYTETLFVPATQPTAPLQIVAPRQYGHQYSVEHQGDFFYISTNLNAPNFCIVKTLITQPSPQYWQMVVPPNDDILIEDFTLFDSYIAVEQRQNAQQQIKIIPKNEPQNAYFLPFDEPCYTIAATDNYDFCTTQFRLSYQSLTTPKTIYDFDMATGEKKLLKQQQVLNGFNPDDYIAERLFAPAADGQQIPISLVRRKDTALNAATPMLLRGYGAYGICYDPIFAISDLNLLNRGFIVGIAHIRGGVEKGKSWYENGKFLHKKNTFTDFIACADYLVTQQYTSHQNLFITGGSAGGLLMGAVINSRPDICRAAIAQVPFVDVLTTMLDPSLPLTTGEYDEWGNPADKIYYDYIRSYSPYDNVSSKNYPAMLVIAGLHDSQVHFWEPAKWVAKLRHLKTDNNTLLLKTNMEAGHGGASGRYDKYKEVAFEHAFMFYILGKI